MTDTCAVSVPRAPMPLAGCGGVLWSPVPTAGYGGTPSPVSVGFSRMSSPMHANYTGDILWSPVSSESYGTATAAFYGGHGATFPPPPFS